MNLLLDTHTLIWLLEGDDNLSQTAKDAIESAENICFVSNASLWEIAIKISIGKLEMKLPYRNLANLISENGIEILPIEFEHFLKISTLPFHHRDPFDRIIIVQAMLENMKIISRDKYFGDYDVSLVW